MALGDIQKPITNTAAANRANSANKVGMQQQMGRMSAQQALQGGPAQAQQAGAMAAEAQGQVAAQAAATDAQNKMQSAANSATQDQLRVQEENIKKEENLRTKGIEQEQEISSMGREYKEELLDSRRNFADYKAEAEFTDHKQNLDLAQELQLSDIDLEDYQREVMQSAEMDVAIMTQAYDAMAAEESRLQKSAANEADRQSLDRIREYKAALQERLNDSKKKSNKFGKVVGAAKFVAGAAITYYSGGTAAGAGTALMADGAGDMSK